MKPLFYGLMLALFPLRLVAGPVQADTVQLASLIEEALSSNPEIEAALQQMYVMDAKVAQEASLPPPELVFMREGMPGFRYGEAMFSRIELMQMFHFPTKFALKREIAEIVADHAHHDHIEKVYDVITRLKLAYDELWYVQQAIALNRRLTEIMTDMATIARTRYSVGGGTQQEVLKSSIELSRLGNQAASLRQRELGMKAMINALVNRNQTDTLGMAALPDSAVLGPSLDSVEVLAARFRPMLQHDSMMVVQNERMLSMARQEYIPDFRLGLQYMTSPMDGFNGWTVTAGITLPFAPWVLGRASGKTEEAEADIARSKALLNLSRNMVRASVRDHYFKASSLLRQLETYRSSILPLTRQSLSAGITAYQAGRGDFVMVLDSYRMLVDMTMESLMLRMEFEQTIARLEREIGVKDISRFR